MRCQIFEQLMRRENGLASFLSPNALHGFVTSCKCYLKFSGTAYAKKKNNFELHSVVHDFLTKAMAPIHPRVDSAFFSTLFERGR
jgi:hypothetical protein